MKKTYSVIGMTCQGCVASVQEKLAMVKGVDSIVVDLDKAEAEIEMDVQIPLESLGRALPSKYQITELQDSPNGGSGKIPVAQSKLGQLKPLFLIFTYLFATVILLHYRDWNTQEAMLDFMGLFYIVFSFFKLLDLQGFPESFRMYDPLAKAAPIYGWIYPFLEIALGLLFLLRVQIEMALWVTIVVLGMTTAGVIKTLVGRKSIRCACLGTALKLPMTEATFIENAIMLAMAVFMLFQTVG